MKDQACSMEITKFYIAEVVVALEYLHNNVRLAITMDLLVSFECVRTDPFLSDSIGRHPP